MAVITGGTIVDRNGERTTDVAIKNGRIEQLGGTTSADDVLVDASGHFVVPGLIDAHVHLIGDGRADSESMMDDTNSRRNYIATANLRAALKAGVTTVRDLGGPEEVTFEARRAVSDGIIEGPDVLAAGRYLVTADEHSHWFCRELDGPDEARELVEDQIDRGADVIKCMVSGSVLNVGGDPHRVELSREELDAICQTASEHRVPTATHAHGKEAIERAVKAGITSVEHGTYMDEETAELMAEHGTYWVPTAKLTADLIEQGTDAGIPAETVAKAEEAAEEIANSFEHALSAGVPIAMGSDAGTPFNYHSEIPEELEVMVDYGMDLDQVFRAATTNAADLLGLDNVGEITSGYRGNIVILDSNPLTDVEAWRNPVHVIKAGQLTT